MRTRRRKIIQDAKNHPCADCGIQYPAYVMDLDHVRGQKMFNISQAVAKGVSDERLLRELSKCDVVCSNCHRVRSFIVGHIRQPGAPIVSRKRQISPEWREKLKNAQTGKKLSEETRAKMRAGRQRYLARKKLKDAKD